MLGLRQVQKQTAASTKTLNMVLDVVRPHLKLPLRPDCKVGGITKTICKGSGAVMLRLHGCVGCDGYVFMPKEPATSCPVCDHPRHKINGQPNEEAFYFPLRPQLQKLLRLENVRKLLGHETTRKTNEAYMTDVYDSPRWSDVMGPATPGVTRVSLQTCVDGVPPFAHGSHESVKPWQHFITGLCYLLLGLALTPYHIHRSTSIDTI